MSTSASAPAAAVVDELITAYATAASMDRALLREPGTTVAAEEARAGTRLASAYRIEQHLLVRCDPAIAEQCRALVERDPTPGLDHFEQALDDRWTHHGRGWVHVIGGDHSWEDDGAASVLDRDDPADRQAIAELIAADPEGADRAEIELDDLDPHIFGVRVAGALVAYASEHPWETDGRFGDIGVLAHPAHRRRNHSLRALHALCRAMVETDRFPLYRCDHVNEPSKALAARAGFIAVAELSAATLEG